MKTFYNSITNFFNIYNLRILIISVRTENHFELAKIISNKKETKKIGKTSRSHKVKSSNLLRSNIMLKNFCNLFRIFKEDEKSLSAHFYRSFDNFTHRAHKNGGTVSPL